MSVFNAAGKAPGVYMQEIDVPGPIAGVSTGIAAIVGPAQSGPLNTPVFVTNWTQFLETFGGNIYTPQIYGPVAVRGFFENGGAVCCYVRVGVGRQAKLTVCDRSPGHKSVFTATAKLEGELGNNIQFDVKDAAISKTTAKKCEATIIKISSDQVTLTVDSTAEAEQFLAGDLLCVNQGPLTEEAEVAVVSVTNKEIKLKTGLARTFSPDDVEQPLTVRLSDLQGKKRVRLESVAGIEPGSYLKFTQADKSIEEYAVVVGLDGKSVLLQSAFSEKLSLSAINSPIDVRSLEFSLEISYQKTAETFNNLSVVPYHSRYFEKIVSASELVTIEPGDTPNPNLPPYNLPDPDYAPNSDVLQDGKDDNPGGLTPKHYFDAIDSLEKATVNIVCVPDAVSFGPKDASVQNYLVNHCERMGDRFAVLDSCHNMAVAGVLSYREDHINASSYAAIYYPWIEIPHPDGQGRIKVPPSGYIAGVYARTDDQKGVHKAPGNELIKGCFGPAAILNDTEHGMLNEASINAIMSVPGSGTTVMGARTLSNSTQWRYINVRRLLLYIEKSIQNATRFAVFLPNNPSLWASVKRQSSDFLNNVWRSGALFGATPDQAFRVKVDEELNPPSVRALGQLIIEIVLYPVTPAEFIVFRVIQQPGGASVSE